MTSVTHQAGKDLNFGKINEPFEDSYVEISKKYAQTKLANLYFNINLHEYLRSQGINNVFVNAVNPGCVKTNFEQ